MLTNLFLSLGINRDHATFLWGKILSLALLINSGIFDLSAQAAYLGIHLTPTGAHWIQALAVGALYLSGQYSTSSLPAGKKMAWVLVAVLGAGVMVSGCASFKAKPMSEQILLELSAAEFGVHADHDFGVNWLSDADVAVFQHIDDTMRQVLATNPPDVKAAAVAAAVIEEGKLPPGSKLDPYLRALVLALQALR